MILNNFPKKKFFCVNSSVVVQYSILKGWVTTNSFTTVDKQVTDYYDGWSECSRQGKRLVSTRNSSVTPNTKNLFVREDKGLSMAQLETSYAEDYEYDDKVVSESEAKDYAAKVAKEAIEAYIAHTGGTNESTSNKGNTVNTNTNNAAEAVKQETLLSAKLVSGEILLDNIETMADKLVIGRLNWFQKLTINKKQKEMAVTLATYAIVHAIKTGGFGITNYRINHVALDYVTLAANQRMVKYLVASVGIDTNLAAMFLKAPEVTVEG